MNRDKFMGIMRYNGDTLASLAPKLGISFERLSAKINEKRGGSFNRAEIALLAKLYEISSMELVSVFFNDAYEEP